MHPPGSSHPFVFCLPGELYLRAGTFPSAPYTFTFHGNSSPVRGNLQAAGEFKNFFFLLTTAPSTRGSSQARGPIRAAAAAYSTDRATLDLRSICDLRHSLWQCQILNPLIEARGCPHGDKVRSLTAEPQRELLGHFNLATNRAQVVSCLLTSAPYAVETPECGFRATPSKSLLISDTL